MKNILSIALVTFSLNVMAQNNKINQQIYKANYDLNHLNNQVAGVNNSVNGTAGNVNESVNTVKGTAKSLINIFTTAKNEVKPTTDAKPQNQTQAPVEIQKPADATSPIPNSITKINISNCTFSTLKELVGSLESNQSITKVEKSLTNGNAQLTLQHSGTTDDITSFIDARLNNHFDIKGFSEGTIELTVKN